MFFRDLIVKNKWEDVENIIIFLRGDYKDCLENFKQVYEELLSLKPVSSINPTVIEVIAGFSESAYSWTVRGRNLKNRSTYNIDTFRWEEWLGFRVDENSLSNMTELEYIVCCLFELTSYGFAQDFVGEEAELDRKMRKAIENEEYDLVKISCPICSGRGTIDKTCLVCDGRGVFVFKEFYDETLN